MAILLVIATVCIAAGCTLKPSQEPLLEKTGPAIGDIVQLPAPETSGAVSVAESLAGRRSVREYAASPLTVADLSQLLWAAQGMTDPAGLRTAPSAGALYPLEVYAACGDVSGLPAGVYRYVPQSHALERKNIKDVRKELFRSASLQAPVRDAPAVIVIAAEYNRTTAKYHDRGIRYVHMEAGHASQNIYLQAYARGIGTGAIGAFDDALVSAVLGLPPEQGPLYLMPAEKVKVEQA